MVEVLSTSAKTVDGGLGLLGGPVLMIANYPTLTGSRLTWVNALPWALPAAAAVGAIAAGSRSVGAASAVDRAETAPTRTT